MPDIHLRRRPDTGGYQVELPARLSPTGKRQVRSFSGPEAETRSREWRDELIRGIRLKKAGVEKEISVPEAVESWLTGPHGKILKPSTLRTNRSAYDKHIEPAFDGLRLRDLTEDRILEFINAKLESGLSPHSVRTIVNVVVRAVRITCRREGVPLPPIGNVGELLTAASRAREIEVKEVQWWTEAEIRIILRIAQTMPDWFALFTQVAADTGMRRGEIMGLQVGDIDFTDGKIRVRRAIVDGKPTSPKSGKARSIMIVPNLSAMLYGYLNARRFTGLGDGDWVFCSDTGWHPRIADIRPYWTRLRKRFAAKGVRPLKFHAFRHSWATHAIANGEPIPWVASQLGHASPAFTLKVYAHAQPRREGRLEWLERRATG